MYSEKRLRILYALFLCTLTTCILLSAKLTTIFGFSLTVGGLGYAITFPITDIVSDVLGKKKARELVMLGLIAYVITTVYSIVAIKVPAASFWVENQGAYETTFGMVPRIVVGSMAAYLVSQLHDLWSFHFWKKITSGKHLWLRNNLSTITSQLIDSAVFVSIAFAFTVDWATLGELVIGQYVIKVAIAAIDTPFVYMGVRWLRDGSELKPITGEFSQITQGKAI